MTSILWLRRDLRRADHPALGQAAQASGEVVCVFVVDPAIVERAGAAPKAWLAATLAATNDAYDGALCLRYGTPEEVVPELAREVGAKEVHISAETEPLGAARDERVREALAGEGVELIATGSPYAVTPGRVVTGGGTPFQVFTPFAKAWRAHGWRGPAAEPDVRFRHVESDPRAQAELDAFLAAPGLPTLPPAGEAGAAERWAHVLDEVIDDYDTTRDIPGVDGTSGISPYLKFGVLHPRTLLADLEGRPGPDADRFRTELAWREFYADVLHAHPRSAWEDLRPGLAELSYDEPGPAFDAWREGRTGFPIVDAGMRQLLAEGWMHNRVRMITASFLTKDLHIWWPHGARHFLDRLIDADLASNNQNWQWTAGTGTDAAPYFRVFNPTTQGKKFDPDGHYVRRYVPELADVPSSAIHTPWDHPAAVGYPAPIVDHAAERVEALARYQVAVGR